MRKKITAFFYLFSILWGINVHGANKSKDGYEIYVNEINRSFARQMWQELNLQCTGDLGMMHEQVEEMGLKFEAYRRATLEEARALAIYVANQFVKAINTHEKIRSHLEVSPFPLDRVMVTISFRGNNGPYADGSIYYVFHGNDDIFLKNGKHKLSYCTYDPFTEKLIDLHEELYLEAERLMNAAPDKHTLFHKATEKEKAIDEVFTAFNKEMGEKYDMLCGSIGEKISEGIEGIGAKFTVFQPAPLEKARELQVIAIERLLELINGSEKLRPFLKTYPFTADRINMLLCFRNKRWNSYRKDSLEDVAIERNEVVYYHRVTYPSEWVEPQWWRQEIEVLAREPYSKALEIVHNTPPDKRKFKKALSK